MPHGVVFAVRGEEGAQPASLLRLHILPVLGPKSLKDITPSDIMVLRMLSMRVDGAIPAVRTAISLERRAS